MYLMQIFVPTFSANHSGFSQHLYTDLKDELTGIFGGVTIYARSPVKGVWKPSPDATEDDNLIIYEVMVQELNLSYWTSLKGRLEARFQQEQILIRYFNIFTVD